MGIPIVFRAEGEFTVVGLGFRSKALGGWVVSGLKVIKPSGSRFRISWVGNSKFAIRILWPRDFEFLAGAISVQTFLSEEFQAFKCQQIQGL